MALTAGARIVFIEIKAQYNGGNNGRIMASERKLAEWTGFSKNAVSRALVELQDKGFIRERQKGSFNPSGDGAGTLWELTELGCFDQKPTKDYRHWRPPENTESRVRNEPQVGPKRTPKRRASGPETDPEYPGGGSEIDPK